MESFPYCTTEELHYLLALNYINKQGSDRERLSQAYVLMGNTISHSRVGDSLTCFSDYLYLRQSLSIKRDNEFLREKTAIR
jgi:hypothetical protein